LFKLLAIISNNAFLFKCITYFLEYGFFSALFTPGIFHSFPIYNYWITEDHLLINNLWAQSNLLWIIYLELCKYNLELFYITSNSLRALESYPLLLKQQMILFWRFDHLLSLVNVLNMISSLFDTFNCKRPHIWGFPQKISVSANMFTQDLYRITV